MPPLHPKAPRRRLGPEDDPELGALIDAANHVATTARNLLTSMLAAGLTIATTMLASSDEAILRDSIEVMHTLGIKAQLSLIFLLVPMFFVFVHLNALVKLYLLFRRLESLEAEMVRRRIPDEEKILWRRLVHGFGFAQILLPPENSQSVRDALHRRLQRMLAWVAIVLAPLIVLLTCQICFVRYQSAWITHIHQGLLLLDLAGLIWFGIGIAPWRRDHLLSGIVRHALPGYGVIVVFWVSWWQAVPPSPSEAADKVHGAAYRSLGDHSIWEYPNVLRDAYLGKVNLLDGVSGLSKWAWTRRYIDVSRLTLLNLDGKPDLLNAFFPDDDVRKKLAKQQSVALDFRGRTLHFANFKGAQMFAANFTSIDARKSVWEAARLDNATFEHAKLHESSFDRADMTGVSLEHATLYRARFVDVRMMGARLEGAQFHGAVLDGVNLTGSFLMNADLRGAAMSEINLTKSNIDGAKIQYTKIDVVNTSDIDGFVESCSGAYIVTRSENEETNIRDKSQTKCKSFWKKKFLADEYEGYIVQRNKFLCSVIEDDRQGGYLSEIHRKIFAADECRGD